MKKTIDFQKHHQAKEKAKSESQALVDHLKEAGPEGNEHWQPEELQEGMTRILYESELRRADK